MVIKFEYDKEVMDFCHMHTINAVENGRMSKLFRFHELLLVTDKLGGKTPRERRMGHLPYLTYLTSREKEDLV